MDANPSDMRNAGKRSGQATDRGVDEAAVRSSHSHIAGWGADLNPADRPAIPKERRPARLSGLHWSEPDLQPIDIEVLHSPERTGVTPVFGTSVPPSGLGGRLRRIAFGYSENDLRHWLLLLFADRVHMVEGLVADLAHGHVPNIYAEMGGPAELKHNPAGAVKKLATVAAVVGLGYLLWSHRPTARRRR